MCSEVPKICYFLPHVTNLWLLSSCRSFSKVAQRHGHHKKPSNFHQTSVAAGGTLISLTLAQFAVASCQSLKGVLCSDFFTTKAMLYVLFLTLIRAEYNLIGCNKDLVMPLVWSSVPQLRILARPIDITPCPISPSGHPKQGQPGCHTVAHLNQSSPEYCPPLLIVAGK